MYILQSNWTYPNIDHTHTGCAPKARYRRWRSLFLVQNLAVVWCCHIDGMTRDYWFYMEGLESAIFHLWFHFIPNRRKHMDVAGIEPMSACTASNSPIHYTTACERKRSMFFDALFESQVHVLGRTWLQRETILVSLFSFLCGFGPIKFSWVSTRTNSWNQAAFNDPVFLPFRFEWQPQRAFLQHA